MGQPTRFDEIVVKKISVGNQELKTKTYLEFSGLLTQGGTNPPTCVIHINEFGVDPEFAYEGVGGYEMRFPDSGIFNAEGDNYEVFLGVPYTGAENLFTSSPIDVNAIGLSTSDEGAPSNGVLYLTSILIRVFPEELGGRS